MKKESNIKTIIMVIITALITTLITASVSNIKDKNNNEIRQSQDIIKLNDKYDALKEAVIDLKSDLKEFRNSFEEYKTKKK